jgi:hypothetical protein
VADIASRRACLSWLASSWLVLCGYRCNWYLLVLVVRTELDDRILPRQQITDRQNCPEKQRSRPYGRLLCTRSRVLNETRGGAMPVSILPARRRRQLCAARAAHGCARRCARRGAVTRTFIVFALSARSQCCEDETEDGRLVRSGMTRSQLARTDGSADDGDDRSVFRRPCPRCSYVSMEHRGHSRPTRPFRPRTTMRARSRRGCEDDGRRAGPALSSRRSASRPSVTFA